MSAGKRRHLCDLQAPQIGVDSIGQPLITWITVRQFWGNIKYQSGIGAIKSGADASVLKVSIQTLDGLFSPSQRVLFQGTIYAIESVLPDGLKKNINLVCNVVAS